MKTLGGDWLVRIDDLDRAREVAGASDEILRTLDAFAFEWDEEVLHQSQQNELYHEASAELERLGLLYPCDCSRKTIAAFGLTGPEGWVYPGTCRRKTRRTNHSDAWRIQTEAVEIQFTDIIQGPVTQDLEKEIGDFILRRSDGLFAYQLAVVVDDAHQGITQVARGADLLLSTPRQIYLQQLLKLATPDYAHLPVVVDDAGKKLSKQSAARPVDKSTPLPALLAAMRHLGQDLEERPENLAEFWRWAISAWDITKVPQQQHQRTT